MEEEALRTYYNRRASVYEAVYQKPERQADLALLAQNLIPRFSGRDVLELACGTGFWTERFAPVASSVLAVDQSDEALAVARKKKLPGVTLVQGDAYHLGAMGCQFTAGFAGFWWSHIPKNKISVFLDGFHARLEPGSPVVFIDNSYVEGSNHLVTRTDDGGNTYQCRHLPDGSVHEVLKNFPCDEELRRSLPPRAVDVEIHRFAYYWLLAYRL